MNNVEEWEDYIKYCEAMNIKVNDFKSLLKYEGGEKDANEVESVESK